MRECEQTYHPSTDQEPTIQPLPYDHPLLETMRIYRYALKAGMIVHKEPKPEHTESRPPFGGSPTVVPR